MASDSLNISLGEPLKSFVEEQAVAGGFTRPDEYVSAVLNAERRRKAEDELERLLLEGLNSGPPIEATEEFWNEKLRRLKTGELTPPP